MLANDGPQTYEDYYGRPEPTCQKTGDREELKGSENNTGTTTTVMLPTCFKCYRTCLRGMGRRANGTIQ